MRYYQDAQLQRLNKKLEAFESLLIDLKRAKLIEDRRASQYELAIDAFDACLKDTYREQVALEEKITTAHANVADIHRRLNKKNMSSHRYIGAAALFSVLAAVIEGFGLLFSNFNATLTPLSILAVTVASICWIWCEVIKHRSDKLTIQMNESNKEIKALEKEKTTSLEHAQDHYHDKIKPHKRRCDEMKIEVHEKDSNMLSFKSEPLGLKPMTLESVAIKPPESPAPENNNASPEDESELQWLMGKVKGLFGM